MGTSNKTPGKERFTPAERKTLSGLSVKVANKHKCSSMYVRHIMKGKRNANSVLAVAIIKDLNTLLKLFHPEE